MKKVVIDEVLACLADTKYVYYHYPDTHVHLLVSRWLDQFNNQAENIEKGRRATVADFKNSDYRRWENKPIIKHWLASHTGRKAVLKPLPHMGLLLNKIHSKNGQGMTESIRPSAYNITFGEWGDDYGDIDNQTSRAGYNLVLQLNLPLDVMRIYERFNIDAATNCQDLCHPVCEERLTMAWVRMDIDFTNAQVLIEEIQSDWIKELGYSLASANHAFCDECNTYNCKKHGAIFHYYGQQIQRELYVKEMQALLAAYKNQWATIALGATLNMIWQQLGKEFEVFYHDYDFGNVLKQCGEPPRSIYTTLPEKFGFQKTKNWPVMLKNDADVQESIRAIKKHRNINECFYRLT